MKSSEIKTVDDIPPCDEDAWRLAFEANKLMKKGCEAGEVKSGNTPAQLHEGMRDPGFKL